MTVGPDFPRWNRSQIMNTTRDKLNIAETVSDETLQAKWTGHMADDVGATYGPEPLATLSATANGLLLSSTRGTFQVPRTAVAKLGRGNFYPWFFSAIRIHHQVPGYPRSLQFKPLGMKSRDLLTQLRQLGYPVP
jgi:hypothetical protein